MVYTRLRMSVIAGIVLCTVSSVLAYSGGSGTSSDPYQIGTVADWNDLMNTQSDWNANFIMIADINLQDIPLIPVGNDLNGPYIYFRGIFDGNGHVIRNAAITGGYLSTGIGLFGRIDPNSQILNLGAEDVNMTGCGRVGGLVGCSYGIIRNCFATGKVRQNWDVSYTSFGGLAGKNFGTITNCHAVCDVNANRKNVGGLVGWNISNIIDSYAYATVNGKDNVGGLVGLNSCTGGETGFGDNIYIGTISRCFARGSVSGNRNVGGLVGNNSEPDDYLGMVSGYINDSYAVCTVTGIPSYGGVTSSGGLAGFCILLGRPPFTAPITHCYAAGRVDANGGGLIGPPFPPVPLLQDSFWDINASGQTQSGGGTGLTTDQMMTLSTFTSAGWDFVDTWGIGENQTYPFLRTYSGADLNYDGLVDFMDFALFAERWLAGS